MVDIYVRRWYLRGGYLGKEELETFVWRRGLEILRWILKVNENEKHNRVNTQISSISCPTQISTKIISFLKHYPPPKWTGILDELLLYYLLYAGDLVLCLDSVEVLQKQLDGLHEFCITLAPWSYYSSIWWHLAYL